MIVLLSMMEQEEGKGIDVGVGSGWSQEVEPRCHL